MPIDKLFGDDEVDTALLKQMAREAQAFLDSRSWCAATQEGYFAGGFGGILAIFLFHIEPTSREIDSWMWAIVGDIPPAYLPLQDAATPKDVFDGYIQGMLRWISVARNEREDGPDIPPVNVPATPEWADHLERRINVLMEMLPGAFLGTIQ